MQNLYTSNYRRPSLRFVQKDLDRRKERATSRQSARLSRAFAMRNLQLPKSTFVTEESSASSSSAQGELSAGLVVPVSKSPVASPRAVQKGNRQKVLVDLQKEKLTRWKDEQQRKKEAMAKKKPFLYAVHLVHEMPKFLTGVTFLHKETKSPGKIFPKATPSAPTKTFALRPRPKQDENRPTLPRIPIAVRTNAGKENRRTRGKKAAPLMSSNLGKNRPRDLFSADESRIELKTDTVSFAPNNFLFTGVHQSQRREVEVTRRSSTPVKEVPPSGSGLSAKVQLRRSHRLQAKSCRKEPGNAAGSSSGTFIVPKTPQQKTQQLAHDLNRLSLLPVVGESTVRGSLSQADNLIDFSDV